MEEQHTPRAVASTAPEVRAASPKKKPPTSVAVAKPAPPPEQQDTPDFTHFRLFPMGAVVGVPMVVPIGAPNPMSKMKRCFSGGSWADSLDDENEDAWEPATASAPVRPTSSSAPANQAASSSSCTAIPSATPRSRQGAATAAARPATPTVGGGGSPVESPRSASPCSGREDPVSPGAPWRALPKEYRHGHVPKNLDLADKYKQEGTSTITTLMIRNIPNRYTQRELIAELEDLGFAGVFDFLYIPLDKGTMSNVGYAFVNFVDPQWATKCMATFQNYRFKRHRKISGKIAAVSPAHIQGLEANLAHYENAAVNTAKLKQRRPVVIANISKTLAGAVQ